MPNCCSGVFLEYVVINECVFTMPCCWSVSHCVLCDFTIAGDTLLLYVSPAWGGEGSCSTLVGGPVSIASQFRGGRNVL